MTPADAKAHAEDVLAQERTANSGYLSSGALVRHAETARILLDILQQLDAAQTEVHVLRAYREMQASEDMA